MFLFCVLVLVLSSIYSVFAIEIFSDGFESGNFSEWTGTYDSGDNIQEVIDTDSYEETYCAHFTDPSGDGSYVYKSISEVSEIYMQHRVKFVDPTTTNEDDTFCMRFSHDVGSWINIVGIEYYSGSGQYKWLLYGRDGVDAAVYRGDLFTLDTDKWYCIELHSVIDGTVGECELWVDGVSVCSLSNIDTNNYGNINYVLSGLCHRAGDEIYVDEVIISDTFISEEQNVTEVLQETASSSESLTDLKEKLVNYGETSSLQTEITTQREGTVTMTETVTETPLITAVLYTSLGVEITVISALTFAVLAFIIAIIAIIIVLAQKK